MMLVARRALDPLLLDAGAAADAAARLAAAHRATPIIGRTLLQQALPTSFGLKAAGWMSGIDEAHAWLRDVRDRALAVQMGGPVGHRDPAIAAAVASELGLAEPLLPWHTLRLRPAGLAAGLGALAGVLGSPVRAACRRSSRPCWRAWSRNTSAPPARGRPSGGRSPTCYG
jgi:3-carboxy-cis,cis-muconate cycloisomerase